MNRSQTTGHRFGAHRVIAPPGALPPGGLPGLGGGMEIQAIAAVFIGGVAWGGGAGSVVGAFLGVALVTVLGNGLDLAAVSSDFQTMITGFLVVLAVGLNARRRKVTGA